jgi:hypothetical protein
VIGVLPATLVAREALERPGWVDARWLGAGLLAMLGLTNAAALLRFVTPYFAGW